MLFADYLLEWLEIAKGRLAVATYSSYAAMIKKPVGPYFLSLIHISQIDFPAVYLVGQRRLQQHLDPTSLMGLRSIARR